MRILLAISSVVLICFLSLLVLIRCVYLYDQTLPEKPTEQTSRIHQELKGVLVNDGCLSPELTKEPFKCSSPYETSYQFKCSKNGKALTGILCRTGKSAYIRYDLKNFSE